MSTKFKYDPTKPTIRIKTRISPFDDGTCRTCYCNHRPIVVQLENGDVITTTPTCCDGNKNENRKYSTLADLFWPSASEGI